MAGLEAGAARSARGVVNGSVPKRYRVRGAKLRFKLKATSLTEPTTVRTTVVQKRR